MRVHVLGPLRVIDDDGVDISPRGMQQRRALAALAAHAPGPVSADALEDVLWPAGAPSSNALQATVSKLRRLVAPGSIEGDGGRSYALIGVDVDLVEFDDAVADERWADAERLVDGVPLTDLDGHVLVAPVVARVEAGHRRARANRLGQAVAAAPAGAIAELEALVAAAPVDETWWALLVQAHAGAGYRRDALEAYQRARRALAAELGLEPGPELRRLEADLLAGADPGSEERGSARPFVRLPRRVASFVGRETTLQGLDAELSDHRLVTVIGPGGAGKTTTVLEVAARTGSDAVFVPLSTVADRHTALRALARATGVVINEQPGTEDDDALLDRIALALRDRALIVILDNCEHVVDVAAGVAEALLLACPDVVVVATSRSPLSVPGERMFALPPLDPSDAIALLRARAADHGADLADADPDLLAAICDRLDGLPLAIELAAARLRSMSLAEVATGLDDRFALLSNGPRRAEPRQQTLRGVVDWSHELLGELDRVVFRRLAVFVGGCSSAAAGEVASGAGPDGVDLSPAEVAAAVERLIDQSLLVVDRGGPVARFSMLETLHDYAAERLAASGERDEVRRRHARWIADVIRPALRGVISHDQAAWFDRLRVERANHRAALDAAFELGEAELALELVAPLGWYFYMAGEMEPAVAAFERALSLPGGADPTLRALTLGMFGWLLANGPDLERAIATTSEAISLIDVVDDPFVRGLVADTHVMALFFAGQIEQAAAFWPVSQSYAEQ